MCCSERIASSDLAPRIPGSRKSGRRTLVHRALARPRSAKRRTAWSLQSAWGKPAKQERRAGSDSFRACGTLRAVIQHSMCVSLMARSCQGAGISGPPLQPQQPWGPRYAICLPDSAAEQAPQKRYRFGRSGPGLRLAVLGRLALSELLQRPRPAGRSAGAAVPLPPLPGTACWRARRCRAGNAGHRPD